MKIAVLSEAFVFEPIIEDLKKLGEVVACEDTTAEADMIERCRGVDVALLNCWVSPLPHTVLDGLTSVKLIVTNTAGYDQIDTAYARSRGIAVANVPGTMTESVAELAVGLMIAVARMIPLADRQMKQSPFWIDPQNKAMHIFKGSTLHGKTLGILGLGRIGERVAEIARGFGMEVIAYNRTPKLVPGVTLRPLDAVLSTSDIISVHLALSSETEKIINQQSLSLMKPGAILINTARDGHVDVDVLYEALKDKKLRGAGLDGISVDASHPILAFDNVVLAPHIGWYTAEAERNIAQTVLENVQGFIAGNLVNVVN